MTQRMRKAVNIIVTVAEENMNQENKGERGRNSSGQFTKARSGINPSKPGGFPHLVTRHLRKNITSEVDRIPAGSGSVIIGRAGTNVIYGKYLETGTRKMARRPWLTLSLQKSKYKMKRILSEGNAI